MDLEIVGRHALFFDDDAMATFVNSRDALVEWNSLKIDRYDVRHLLSAPPPQSRRSLPSLSHAIDSSLKSDLDLERYLDLPPSSDDPEKEEEEEDGEHLVNTGGYRAIPFSYGNVNGYAEEVIPDMGIESSGFRPSFNVPEHLLQCLPPSEKVHQIIARTAQFVSRHGGQSEIVLRVKQGDNPTFGFLMPDHYLHLYYRFLVDHQELLHSNGDGKPQNDERKAVSEPDGALSLLGSVYGSGEDEDALIGDVSNNIASNEVVDAVPYHAHDKGESSEIVPRQDEIILKHPLHSGVLDKEKTHLLKKSPLVSGSKNGSTSHKKLKDDSISASIYAALEKLKASGLGITVKTEPVVLEPPSDLKKLIGKIVEFIVKNGKQFEATLIDQDSKHGRFPFLLPSNMYHPYYLKVLHGAQESKVSGKSFLSGNDDSIGQPPEKRASLSLGSGDSDLPYEFDKKEKFKMVIGKSKKESQESSDKVPQQENGFSVDAAAAAAILQAAARGIKTPNLGIFSKPAVNATEGSLSNAEPQLSKEQKLKAERLKKAKMFVAMLKNGAVPVKSEPSRGVSSEPHDSHQLNGNMSDQGEKPKFTDEYNEKRSMRKYRSRSGRGEEEEESDEAESEEGKGHKRSRKKHHRSDDEERGHRHSRRKHRSHKRDDDDEERYEEEENHHRDSRKKHKSHHRSSHHKSRHERSKRASDDDEHHHQHKSDKHRREDLEEGEISGGKVLDQPAISREASQDICSPRQRSTSQPSESAQPTDDLRAKIRAMLMETRR